MAEGWVLIAGLAALFGVIGISAVVLRARRGSPEPQDSLFVLGPTLVVLGLIFGEDPLLGYGLIVAGVALSILAAILRRPAASH